MVKVIHVASGIVDVYDALMTVTARINKELEVINGVVQRVEIPQYEMYPAYENSGGPGAMQKVRAYAMVVITYTPNTSANTGFPNSALAF